MTDNLRQKSRKRGRDREVEAHRGFQGTEESVGEKKKIIQRRASPQVYGKGDTV